MTAPLTRLERLVLELLQEALAMATPEHRARYRERMLRLLRRSESTPRTQARMRMVRT